MIALVRVVRGPDIVCEKAKGLAIAGYFPHLQPTPTPTPDYYEARVGCRTCKVCRHAFPISQFVYANSTNVARTCRGCRGETLGAM